MMAFLAAPSSDDWKGIGVILTIITPLGYALKWAVESVQARKDTRTTELERREKAATDREESIAKRLSEANQFLSDKLREIQSELSKSDAQMERYTIQIRDMVKQRDEDGIQIRTLTDRIEVQSNQLKIQSIQITEMSSEIEKLRKQLGMGK